jgi:hypothetical protein
VNTAAGGLTEVLKLKGDFKKPTLQTDRCQEMAKAHPTRRTGIKQQQSIFNIILLCQKKQYFSILTYDIDNIHRCASFSSPSVKFLKKNISSETTAPISFKPIKTKRRYQI